jgi:hypothetical protein
MDDDCTDCNIQNLQLSNFSDCTIKNVKKFCKKIHECKNVEDVQHLLNENDTILYITTYLAICWIILQPFRK